MGDNFFISRSHDAHYRNMAVSMATDAPTLDLLNVLAIDGNTQDLRDDALIAIRAVFNLREANQDLLEKLNNVMKRTDNETI